MNKKSDLKHLLWVSIVFWGAAYTAIEAPFSLVFHGRIHTWQLVLDAVFSIIFGLDFYFHYKEIKSLENSKSYTKRLKAPKPFAKYTFLTFDFVACIPFDLLGAFIGLPHVFIILRLLRLFRVYKIVQTINEMANVPTWFRIQVIAIISLIVLNWIACGWIAIYPKPDDVSVTSYFIKCFYWTITTVATIGYGDITPTTDGGRIYTCFIEIIGVGMYGIVIGNITQMMAAADRHKEQTREKLNDLLLFMKHYHIPHHLQEAAFNHYNHLLSKRLTDNDEKIISELPHALQDEIQIYMKIKLISAIPIFHGLGHECLKEVAKSLEQIYTAPGDYVIRVGEMGHEMFIIAHGSVDVSIADGTIVANLHDGQIFGEIALIKETTRTANIISQSYCDLYKLTDENFKILTKQFPKLLENIEKNTQRRPTDKK